MTNTPLHFKRSLEFVQSRLLPPPRVVCMSLAGVSGPFSYPVMIRQPSTFHSVFSAILGRVANSNGAVTSRLIVKK